MMLKQPPDIFCKNVLLKISLIHKKHMRWSLYLIRLKVFRPAALLKENATNLFSSEFCEIFKNT